LRVSGRQRAHPWQRPVRVWARVSGIGNATHWSRLRTRRACSAGRGRAAPALGWLTRMGWASACHSVTSSQVDISRAFSNLTSTSISSTHTRTAGKTKHRLSLISGLATFSACMSSPKLTQRPSGRPMRAAESSRLPLSCDGVSPASWTTLRPGNKLVGSPPGRRYQNAPGASGRAKSIGSFTLAEGAGNEAADSPHGTAPPSLATQLCDQGSQRRRPPNAAPDGCLPSLNWPNRVGSSRSRVDSRGSRRRPSGGSIYLAEMITCWAPMSSI
jgi:hypothetical protein